MFDNPPDTVTGTCWTWHGSTGGRDLLTPMMKFEGKPRPVRNILVGPYSLVICGNPFCVNPSHAKPAISRLLDDGPEPATEPAEIEPEPPAEIDEVIEMLAEGFTEAQLLTMYDPSIVAEALRAAT